MADSIIIGAGISGLGAAFASGFQYPIYEKKSHPGGLCHSFFINGFTFDSGVHLSFTKDNLVRSIFDKIPFESYNPYPINWYKDRWVKHPVQNNLFALNVDERVKAVMGFINRSKSSKIDNFHDWLIYQYGDYIAENFSHIYNLKYWCEDLHELGIDWINNRLYQPSLEETIYGSFVSDTKNTYYASEMRYPLSGGGYEEFISYLIRQADIRYNKKLIGINTCDKSVMFSDNTVLGYDKIFSSIPLPELVALIDNVPSEVAVAAKNLGHTGVALVSVAFNVSKIIDNIWFYIYDTDILAARVYSPSNKSMFNSPADCSSLQFEIYFNGKNTPPDKQTCIDNVVYAIEKMGIANRSDILFIDYRIEDYANVIMFNDNGKNCEIIRNFLRSIDIVPIGRFGEWDYLWSDQSLLSGYNAVLSNTSEPRKF